MRELAFSLLCVASCLAAAESSRAVGRANVVVRVVTATMPDIVSIPDSRAFEAFLPLEYPGATASVAYVPGASRAIYSLIADEADVAIATIPSGLVAIEEGQDLVAFSLASGAKPYLHMVAHTSVQGWKDLEGRKVAIIGPVDATQYLAEMQVGAAGANPQKVVWRAVGGGSGRVAALAAGVANAAMLQSAQAVEMLARGPFHVLAPPMVRGGRFIFKAYWARRAFLRENPDLAEAIVRAHLRAVHEALDKPRFVALAAAALGQMPTETISRAYDLVMEHGIWEPDGDLFTRKSADSTVAELVRAKILKSPLHFDQWATTTYLQSALARPTLQSALARPTARR